MTGEGLRKRRSPDPSLPHATVRDTGISFRALGALLWIMDKPDGWAIRPDQMAKDGKRPDGTNSNGRTHRREGREAIRTALLEELAAEGYYRLERRRLLDGSVVMGTAASEDRVDSWAKQHELFGRRAPVPLVQQPDGTFLVRYPDGTFGPDDCDPPEVQQFASEDEQDEETAGQTGAQKPVSGVSPAPRNPAPVKPASGEAASGNPSPLSTKKKEKGFKEKNYPPTPRPGTAGSNGAGTVTGGELNLSQKDKDFLNAGREKALQLRDGQPGWTMEDIIEAMTAALAAGRSAQDVAAAIAIAADQPDTRFPTRINNDLWWTAAIGAAFVPSPPRPSAPCPKPAHQSYSATNCTACKVDERQEALDRDRDEDGVGRPAVPWPLRRGAVAEASNADPALSGADVPQQARRTAPQRPGRSKTRARV